MLLPSKGTITPSGEIVLFFPRLRLWYCTCVPVKCCFFSCPRAMALLPLLLLRRGCVNYYLVLVCRTNIIFFVFRAKATNISRQVARCVIHPPIVLVLLHCHGYVRAHARPGIRKCATPDNRQLRVDAGGASMILISRLYCFIPTKALPLHVYEDSSDMASRNAFGRRSVPLRSFQDGLNIQR